MVEHFCLTVGNDEIVATVEDGYIRRYIQRDDNGEYGIVNIANPPKVSDLLDQGAEVAYEVSAEEKERLWKMTTWSIIADGVEVKWERFAAYGWTTTV